MATGGPFLYDLPASVLYEFCWIMDGLSDLDWTRFASEVLCDQTSLRLAERRERRTEWVMNQWVNRNGRVCELIGLLESLQLLRPRDVIQRWSYRLWSPAPPPSLPPSLPPSRPQCPPSQTPSLLTQSTCRLSEGETSSSSVNKGGERPLPKPAPPPLDLQSVPDKPPQRPLEVPCSTVMSWSYEEVHAGTDGFSPSLQVGEGGFGVVYRAKLRKTDCAVKRLTQDRVMEWAQLKESFHTEVDKLTRFRHPNIVDLIGISEGPECVCLIYSYMENGSLDDQLHNGGALSWSQRLSVVEGASKALQFLHSPPKDQKPLIHGDVKSSNILLDRYHEAKLADFGLARYMHGDCSNRQGTQTVSVGRTETVRGTLAYLPEEYVRDKQLGPAVDVFSFGVVLLEVLTGRRALAKDKTGERYLRDLVKEIEDSPAGSGAAAWRQQLDHRLLSGGAEEPTGYMEVVSLACKCLKNRRKRPHMGEVFDQLQDIRSRVRRTGSSSNSSSSSSPSPSHHPHLPSMFVPRPSRPRDSSVGTLSQQMSKLGPLEDTYHPSMSSNSSCSLPPPSPLHSSSSLPLSSSSLPPGSSSFDGPCETDESRGFSQYNLHSQCRSSWTSSRSLSPSTRNQNPGPARPTESPFNQPSVPTEDLYSFTQVPGSSCGSAGARVLKPPGPETGGPTTGGATSGLCRAAGSLSPAGSLHSSSSGSPVVINSSKLRLLQKKTMYDNGEIRTPELLSAEDIYGGSSSVEARGPEESDELDFLPTQHT